MVLYICYDNRLWPWTRPLYYLHLCVRFYLSFKCKNPLQRFSSISSGSQFFVLYYIMNVRQIWIFVYRVCFYHTLIVQVFETCAFYACSLLPSTSWRESCDIPVAFTFCLFKYSQRCAVRLVSVTVKRKASVLYAIFWTSNRPETRATAYWGPLSCQKANPFPHNIKSEGKACLWRGVCLWSVCRSTQVGHRFLKRQISSHLNIDTLFVVCRLYLYRTRYHAQRITCLVCMSRSTEKILFGL